MGLKLLATWVIQNWHSFKLSLGVWAGWIVIFLVLELLPVFWKKCPWETLSNTSWDAQSAWHPATAIFAAFLFVLALHILRHLPATWLITTVIGAAIALCVHLILVKFGKHPAWL